MDFRQWLDQHRLGKYVDRLAENEVDFDVLPELEEAERGCHWKIDRRRQQNPFSGDRCCAHRQTRNVPGGCS
jgi:hypothetical protein